jgi:hypothetical protein
MDRFSLSIDSLHCFLTNVIRKPEIHSRFLNTLSYMEHLGARKIHLTQTAPNVSESILKHASEEARHAHFFKKQSLKIYPVDNLGILAPNQAERYFLKLEAMTIHSLRKSNVPKNQWSKLTYLYTTKLIEERAGILYKIYNDILIKSNSVFRLNSIIKEEESHLDEMNSSLARLDQAFETRFQFLSAKESANFEKFLNAMNSEITQEQAIPV